MEEINYNLLSNDELTKKYKNLEELFKKSQDILKEQYFLMKKYSEEFIKIKNIIKKRGGKL